MSGIAASPAPARVLPGRAGVVPGSCPDRICHESS